MPFCLQVVSSLFFTSLSLAPMLEIVLFSIPTRTLKCLHLELRGSFDKNQHVLGTGKLSTGYSGLWAPLPFNYSVQMALLTTSSSGPAPSRRQRVESIIFPTAPSLFPDSSHLDGLWIPWLPVSVLTEGPKCQFQLSPAFCFSFSFFPHFYSTAFADNILLGKHEI